MAQALALRRGVLLPEKLLQGEPVVGAVKLELSVPLAEKEVVGELEAQKAAEALGQPLALRVTRELPLTVSVALLLRLPLMEALSLPHALPLRLPLGVILRLGLRETEALLL